MIQNRGHEDRIVKGSLHGESIKMGVADISHILNVVTDLYSDRELACIREYATNAVDAHIEAGVVRPIEVTTPTDMFPFFMVQDFGVGLTLEDIRTIYSQYGASTKRNTNAQTGMLGLGCKSALTYSDTFTVTSVKDGVRIQVVVSRDATGASMKVVDTSSTTDSNGTTVTIPRNGRWDGFTTKAKAFFSHWKPGTVLLNGAEPDFMPHAKWVTDSIAINGERHSRIVMGGVPYPADLNHGIGWSSGITAFVEIGDVDFAPSRESLMDTDTTKATIARVEADFRAGLHTAIQKEIEAAPSPSKAIEIRNEWNSKVGLSNMPARPLYKGREIPVRMGGPKGSIYASPGDYKLSSYSSFDGGVHMYAQTFVGALWVRGWDAANMTATTKKKLNHFAEQSGKSYPTYILTPVEPSASDKFWLKDTEFVDWADIKAIKLPRAAKAATTTSGRIPGSYDIYEDGSYNEGVPADDIDQTKPIFWGLKRNLTGHEAAWLKTNYPGSTLVLLTAPRVEKFQRSFPKAQEVRPIIKAGFEAWINGIDKDDALALAVQNDYRLSDLQYIDAAKVDDPAVKHAISVRNRDASKLETEITMWTRLGFPHRIKADTSTYNPLKRYILLDLGYMYRYDGRGQMDHVYRYMNNEYASQKGN